MALTKCLQTVCQYYESCYPQELPTRVYQSVRTAHHTTLCQERDRRFVTNIGPIKIVNHNLHMTVSSDYTYRN